MGMELCRKWFVANQFSLVLSEVQSTGVKCMRWTSLEKTRDLRSVKSRISKAVSFQQWLNELLERPVYCLTLGIKFVKGKARIKA